MIEKYLGFDSIPPAGLLLHRNYNYYGRHFTVDSIKTTYGGYKLFFSGNPTTSNYSFQIYEQYKGLKSNSYQVNFMTDYLSKTKVGFEYQLINLSSHKYYNWEDISNPSNSSNQSDTSRFEYNYKYFYTYISYYLNRRLVLDWNLNQLYYKIANKFPAEYIPIMRLSYEFGPPNYLKLSPLITLGSSGLNKDSGTVILGYGGSFTWCYKKVVFISIGAEYLDGITYDFKGVSYHYSIRFDMIKLIKELVNKSDK
jgi:hypothetical protein